MPLVLATDIDQSNGLHVINDRALPNDPRRILEALMYFQINRKDLEKDIKWHYFKNRIRQVAERCKMYKNRLIYFLLGIIALIFLFVY